MTHILTKLQEWFKKEKTRFQGAVHLDVPLSKHSYFQVGGPAEVLLEPKSIEDLKHISEGLSVIKGVPVFILGAGSNLLVSDDGFKGLVVKTGKLNRDIHLLENSNKLLIRTGSSVAVSSLLRRASLEGWGGFEFMAGIPGSIGGVVAMNAGTHLGEAKDRLARVETFSLFEGQAIQNEGDQLRFEYRKNLFLSEGVLVYSADWAIQKCDPTKTRLLIEEILTRRKETQPLNAPSCGSVFKNPKQSPLKAWQVIDKLGLRGTRIGQAQFSEKHCNFILNLGEAKAVDIYRLIQLAKQKAKEKLGVALEEEVKFLGKFDG